MFRKLAIVIAIAMLAFTTGCSSKTSTANNTAAGTNVSATSTSAATACPTKNTKAFAKTRFVADIALAGGAFKRWIYTPAKDGKFKKGAHGKIVALIKAAAAGAFVINRLNAAKNAAQANPTLCKVLVKPLANFSSAVTGLIGKAKHGAGTIDPSDVTTGDNYLTNMHTAATQGGAPFTDNLNTNA